MKNSSTKFRELLTAKKSCKKTKINIVLMNKEKLKPKKRKNKKKRLNDKSNYKKN